MRQTVENNSSSYYKFSGYGKVTNKPSPAGYFRIRYKNGHRLYHRVVYEMYYSCCILPGVEIDHINGIKTDNRIENLRLLRKGEHTKRHHKKDFSNRLCRVCEMKTSFIKGYERWHGNDNTGFQCHKCYMVDYHAKQKL